jgi:hypothetical protein
MEEQRKKKHKGLDIKQIYVYVYQRDSSGMTVRLIARRKLLLFLLQESSAFAQ